MRKLIVGCPIRNDLDSFTEMIKSLFESSQTEFDFIIIESGSDTKTINYLDSLDKIYPLKKIKVLHVEDKTPLQKYNRLFDIAIEEKADLFLTQTDVLFPKLYKRDWLDQMKTVAQDSTCGMVTCLNGGGVSGPSYLNGLNWVGAWCTYIPYRTLEKIGKYDNNYPNGWGVDIDYSYAIFKAGLRLYKINYWVDHHMMNDRSHDDDEKGKQEAAKYFRKKWQI